MCLISINVYAYNYFTFTYMHITVVLFYTSHVQLWGLMRIDASSSLGGTVAKLMLLPASLPLAR